MHETDDDDRMRATLLDHALRWGVALDDDKTITTASAMLGFGVRNSHPVVLKLLRARSDEHAGIAALRHFGRTGVGVIEATDGAALLEQAVPGTHLTELVLSGRDQEATEILCRIMAAIHAPAAHASEFVKVEDWERGFQRYVESGNASLPLGLISRASRLFHDLCRSQGNRCFLHGDLHHDNVVLDARRGWLVIDPKGVIGEPAYEVGAALRNPASDPRWFAERNIVERRVDAYARALNVGRDRVAAWAYAQAALSAIWSVEDGDDPTTGLVAASAFESIIA